MNWDDLRFILAVARHGTITDGARAVRVNATTVSRRLRAMEEEAGTRLFDKFKHGAVLTSAGEEMLAAAETIEQVTNALDARIIGQDTKLEGTLRISAPPLALRRWIGDFGEFRRRYDGIDLELASGIEAANLTQREADVAIRLGPAPEHLFGKKHGRIHLAVYGNDALVTAMGEAASYADYPWLAWDLAVSRSSDLWLAKHAPKAHVAIRFDSMALLVDALEAGLGIATLPCLAGDANPKLRRVGTHLGKGPDLWVLTHPELRRTSRVRAFMAFMGELTARDKDLIEGLSPRLL